MSKLDFERAGINFDFARNENDKDNPSLIKEKAELYQGLSHLAAGLMDLTESLDKLIQKQK